MQYFERLSNGIHCALLFIQYAHFIKHIMCVWNIYIYTHMCLSTNTHTHTHTHIYIMWDIYTYIYIAIPDGSDCKESAYNVEDQGLVPGSGRASEEGHGNSLWYSCLENSMDSGAWWDTVHGGHKESNMTEWLKLSLSYIYLYLYVYNYWTWLRMQRNTENDPCSQLQSRRRGDTKGTF